jgi:hypothetical protein
MICPTGQAKNFSKQGWTPSRPTGAGRILQSAAPGSSVTFRTDSATSIRQHIPVHPVIFAFARRSLFRRAFARLLIAMRDIERASSLDRRTQERNPFQTAFLFGAPTHERTMKFSKCLDTVILRSHFLGTIPRRENYAIVGGQTFTGPRAAFSPERAPGRLFQVAARSEV